MSDLTSLPDHEELIVVLVLILIQSEFNPHPEVGYVIRI